MEYEVESRIAVAERVSRAIQELKALQDPLLSGEVDPQTLTDFRDALRFFSKTRAKYRPCWHRSAFVRPISCACRSETMFTEGILRLRKGNCWSSTKSPKPWSMN